MTRIPPFASAASRMAAMRQQVDRLRSARVQAEQPTVQDVASAMLANLHKAAKRADSADNKLADTVPPHIKAMAVWEVRGQRVHITPKSFATRHRLTQWLRGDGRRAMREAGVTYKLLTPGGTSGKL